MSTTAVYCAALDIRNALPQTPEEREEFLFDKLREVLGELFDVRAIEACIRKYADDNGLYPSDTLEMLQRVLDDLDEARIAVEDLKEAKEDLAHEKDTVANVRSDFDDLSREFDAMKARAEKAEAHIKDMHAGLHALRFSRRGNTIHVHLPEALHVPVRRFDPDSKERWNTIAVPVRLVRDGRATRKTCACCESTIRKHAEMGSPKGTATTWLATIEEPSAR